MSSECSSETTFVLPSLRGLADEFSAVPSVIKPDRPNAHRVMDQHPFLTLALDRLRNAPPSLPDRHSTRTAVLHLVHQAHTSTINQVPKHVHNAPQDKWQKPDQRAVRHVGRVQHQTRPKLHVHRLQPLESINDQKYQFAQRGTRLVQLDGGVYSNVWISRVI